MKTQSNGIQTSSILQTIYQTQYKITKGRGKGSQRNQKK